MNDTKFSLRRRIWGGAMRGLMLLCAGLTSIRDSVEGGDGR